MKDVVVWQIIDGLGLCYFIFKGGQCYLEGQDVVIVSCLFGYSETSKDYNIYITSQWNIVVTRDMKFGEDVWSSKSKVSPSIRK
jgi:hypothetical protein